MLVWKGAGLLVIVFVFLFVLPIEMWVEHTWGVGQYKALPWPIPLAILLGAIPTTITGIKLNGRPGRVLLDPETGEQVIIKPRHSLFWIPMQYWGPIMAIISAWMYLHNIGFHL